MTTTEQIDTAALGQQGEPCQDCGSPLATDQRYCLSCGARRGGPRVPFEAAASPGAPPPEHRAVSAPGREWTPLTAIGLVAVIALILVSGVLIGRGGGDSGKSQVVSVGGGGPAASDQAGAANIQTAAFKSDWPSGKNGYTVELGVLKKDGTTAAQVKTAKGDAKSKGAKNVGALDSNQYQSLPGGQYVLFSGVYSTKASASKALGSLRGKFPSAKVVKVSASAGGGGTTSAGTTSADTGGNGDAKVNRQQLQKLNNLSGDAYVKRSKKLPDTTGVAGKPPPKDNGSAGGGGQAVEIK